MALVNTNSSIVSIQSIENCFNILRIWKLVKNYKYITQNDLRRIVHIIISQILSKIAINKNQ